MSSVNPFAEVIAWLDTEEGLQWQAENHRLIQHAYAIGPVSDDPRVGYDNVFRFATVKVDGSLCSKSGGDSGHVYCTEGAMFWTAGETIGSLDGVFIPLKAIEGVMPSCP